jgi:peroxiredoxin 2/4
MKKYIPLALLLITLNLYSQTENDVRIPVIGQRAPAFIANTTQGEINFPNDYFDKWKILFSHPADFTPVCTSEILELSYLQDKFEDLNTKILVISTDGINSHLEWIKSIESISYKDRKPVKINFPLIADLNMTISKQYGMIHPYISSNHNVRGVFIIDPKNKIRAIFFYPMNIGRNFDEILRTLAALQKADSDDILTPANWTKGCDVLLPSPKNPEESEKMKAKNDPDYYSLNWYMWFKKSK